MSFSLQSSYPFLIRSFRFIIAYRHALSNVPKCRKPGICPESSQSISGTVCAKNNRIESNKKPTILKAWQQKEDEGKSNCLSSRYWRRIEHTSVQQGVEDIQQFSCYGNDRFFAAEAGLPHPEPLLEFAAALLYGSPCALNKDRFYIRIPVQRLAAFDRIGGAVIIPACQPFSLLPNTSPIFTVAFFSISSRTWV